MPKHQRPRRILRLRRKVPVPLPAASLMIVSGAPDGMRHHIDSMEIGKQLYHCHTTCTRPGATGSGIYTGCAQSSDVPPISRSGTTLLWALPEPGSKATITTTNIDQLRSLVKRSIITPATSLPLRQPGETPAITWMRPACTGVRPAFRSSNNSYSLQPLSP